MPAGRNTNNFSGAAKTVDSALVSDDGRTPEVLTSRAMLVIPAQIRIVLSNACEAGWQECGLNVRVNVLALTILISSCLGGIFICCFAGEYRRRRDRSLERDSLLPLGDAPRSPLTGKAQP